MPLPPPGSSQDIPSDSPITVIYENGVKVTFGVPRPDGVTVTYPLGQPRQFASKAEWHQWEEDSRHYTDQDYINAGMEIPERWWKA